MLRSVLLSASRNASIKHLATGLPVTRGVVARYVAGESVDQAIDVTRRLVQSGLAVSLDHLGEDTTDAASADAAAHASIDLLDRLATAGLSQRAEVSVKLSAIGQLLAGDGPALALDSARMICAAAQAAGTTVTLDMEDHTTTDSTLSLLAELRREFPRTGAVMQAYLYRTEDDCRTLATAGSRIRLCKGAYSEPVSVAHTEAHEIDKAYVRCLRILMEGDGYPMVATHDPRLIAIAEELVRRTGRTPDSYEFQMLYGIRPAEQQRLARAGHTVRVYVPYGRDWYGYLVRRMAEKPANLGLFVTSLIRRG